MKKNLIFILLLCQYSICFSQIKRPEHYPDDPGAREEYDYLRLRDPATGEIPPFIAQREFEFASKLPKKDPFGAKSTSLQAFDWQPAGPWNQSGRVQAIGIDILNEQNMLAGTASGGVWRSIDSGQSWVKVTLPNDEQSISAIVQDTRATKESIWYYSTGELLSTTGRRLTSDIRTHSWGNGIYRSTDNGASWNPIASTVTTSTNTAPINFTGIWNLAVDKGGNIFAACYGGIMRSSDDGKTWIDVLGNDSLRCFNSEIVIGSKGTYYAAIGSTSEGKATPHQGIWRSTDGINWTKISNSLLPTLIRRTRLALSESNDSILYCLTEAPVNWSLADQDFITQHTLSQYSYTSGNGSGSGGSWTSLVCPFDMNQNQYNNSLGGYCLALAVHPNDPYQVMVGGNNLYYSIDGFQGDATEIGGYWYDVSQGPIYPLHPDIHVIKFSHKDPSVLYVGNDGGISTTTDYTLGEADWFDFNNGLSSAQVYYSALNHGASGDNFILSGLQDNNTFATMSDNPTDPWDAVFGGDGMTSAITNDGSLFFASYQSANIGVLSFDGTNMTYHGQLPPPQSNATPNFFTNYILEPNGTNELYLAYYDQLWRYNDLFNLQGEFNNNYLDYDWSQIPEVSDILNPLNAFITTFGFATDIHNRLFFGTNIGRVYEVDNANTVATVKEISGSAFPVNGYVSGIEVDPDNANNIFVVFSNYHVQSLFHTTDGGTSWAAVGGNLEELPDGAGVGPSVRCLRILHTGIGQPPIYYVGTSVGLYSTTKLNGMQTVWSQEAVSTIGNLIVENIDVRQSDKTVIVSTQGGGVFKNASTNAVGNSSISSGESMMVGQNFPNPFHNESKIQFMLTKDRIVLVELYNALGEKISVIANSQFAEGTHTIELSGKRLAAGNYFLRFSDGSNITTKMITVIK
jgi:photosystem II stability/assembly factor-like uncharacterized protein